MSAGVAPALGLSSGSAGETARGTAGGALRLGSGEAADATFCGRYLFAGATRLVAGYGFALRGAGRGRDETFSIVRP